MDKTPIGSAITRDGWFEATFYGDGTCELVEITRTESRLLKRKPIQFIQMRRWNPRDFHAFIPHIPMGEEVKS
ncbi:MAG: hypothetical protein K8L99_15290 [Anaerolineae bacterium]|nr:hypothetical protein [Anaerolineae bacterium]